MDRPSKSKAPSLSLIVPSSSRVVAEQGLRLTPQTPRRGYIIAPAKQKRLFPISCRFVPTDQWFTTRIDRTWQVLDLKIWLLSKALPTSVLPLPASYRPSSPVTFAAAPPPPPLPRPPVSTSYHASEPSVGAIPSSVLSISPITFAAAPNFLSRPSISSSPHSPPTLPFQQKSSSPSLSPNPHPSYPPLSPPAEAPPHPSSAPLVPEHATSPRLSPDLADVGVPLYANPYGTILDENFYDDDDDDETVRITPRSIPYSYNTGTPAISGLAALESNRNPAGRNYGGSTSIIEADILRKATTIAKRWHVYSFSTGVLLSDDFPLSEYNIRPYELLELHRASAYISLPRTIIPASEPYSPPHSRDQSRVPHSSTTKTSHAYHSATSRRPSPPHMHEATPSSESSEDECEDVPVGSPYAQPYFDGWVWVLREGASAANGHAETGVNDAGDTDGPHGRKMRRRGRAKSEASKSGKGKDRARMEREWKDLQQPLGKEAETEAQLPENDDLWKKRWLVVREGCLTVWRERKDTLPEERYEIAACAGLYGADRLQLATAAVLPNIAPFGEPLFPNPTSSQAFMSTSSVSGSSLAHSPHIICARFRQGSSYSNKHAGRKGGKSSRRAQPRSGIWLVLKLSDETSHEHLLRIFHRLSYSTSISSSRRHPAASSSVAQARTLRTDFLPNPIPHPLSLSFSAPSPIEQSDGSSVWPFDDLAPSDTSEYDDGWIDADFAWRRSRQRSNGKGTARYVGLGRTMGVRYPEWREGIIRNAIHAGLGLNLPEPWGRADLSPEAETPHDDQLDVYGFVREDVESYTPRFSRAYDDSDDTGSDAFSEAEWEGWAYDLDRPKAVEESGTRHGPAHKRTPSGLHTPHGSPVSDDPPLPAVSDPVLNAASTPSSSALRPRARSVQADNSNASPPPQSPTLVSPTTPGTRLRASTMSTHPRNTTLVAAEPTSRAASRFMTSASSQVDHQVRTDETTTLRTVEPNTTASGVRGLMRGLNKRVGKESFMRGLENALDFVEGK